MPTSSLILLFEYLQRFIYQKKRRIILLKDFQMVIFIFSVGEWNRYTVGNQGLIKAIPFTLSAIMLPPPKKKAKTSLIRDLLKLVV